MSRKLSYGKNKITLSYSNFMTEGYVKFTPAQQAYIKILAFTAGITNSESSVYYLLSSYASIKGINLPRHPYYYYPSGYDNASVVAKELKENYVIPDFSYDSNECRILVLELISSLIGDIDFENAIRDNLFIASDNRCTSITYAMLYKYAILNNDEDFLFTIEEIYENHNNRETLLFAAQKAALSVYYLINPDSIWFDSLDNRIKNMLFNLAVHQFLAYGYVNDFIFNEMKKVDFDITPFAGFNGPLIYKALNGDENAAILYIKKEKLTSKKNVKQFNLAIKTALSFLYGMDDNLDTQIEQIHKNFNKGNNIAKRYDIGARVLESIMFLGIIKQGTISDRKLLLENFSLTDYERELPLSVTMPFGGGFQGITAVRGFCRLAVNDFDTALEWFKNTDNNRAFGNYFDEMLWCALKIRLNQAEKSDLTTLYSLYNKFQNLTLMQDICADLILHHPLLKSYGKEPYPCTHRFADLSTMVEDLPQWQKKIDTLSEIFDIKKDENYNLPQVPKDTKKVAWIINYDLTEIRANEQKISKSGDLTYGKHISLLQLVKNTADFDFLNDNDKKIINRLKAIDAEDVIRNKNSYYSIKRLSATSVPLEDVAETLTGDAGNLFIENDKDNNDKIIRKVSLQKSALKCNITESKDIYELTLDADINDFIERCDNYYYHGSHDYFRLEENDIVKWYHIGTKEVDAYKVIGNGLKFPKKELNRILPLINGNTSVLSVNYDFGSKTVEADSRIVLQMEQKDGFFTGFVGVKPFMKQHTPLYPVAMGPQKPIISVPESIQNINKKTTKKGANVQDTSSKLMVTLSCERDFEKEEQNLNTLLSKCPTLSDNYEEGYLSLDNIESLLTMLEEIEQSGTEHILEWARDNFIRVSKPVDFKSVHLKIVKSKKAGEWFNVEGELDIDKDRYVSIQLLLESMKGSRFVSIGNGEYIALTDKLRKKLATLKQTVNVEKKDLVVNSLAAGALSETLEDLDVESDPKWEASVSRMKKAFATNPKLPSTLQAQLRDYQEEGYIWMQRLAIWGVGACLADDMGLGKTVQAIAVLLNQAQKGPCLILAPTSVSGNWINELTKFAPSLNLYQFEQKNREELIKSLGKNDILIVGYGLLANVESILTSIKWSMVVFDEAQALKNNETKRARAGRKIEADFKLALTGTPIENRIEELWSLFDNINPGLLGSWNTFHERFKDVSPGSADSKSLKRLVRPFLLRRLKSAVLEELPSRTEQNIIVEMNDKEKVFYDNLRKSLLDELNTTEPKNKKFMILAGLTRLRRACCHPQLADKDMIMLEERSSKIDKFIEIVKDLSEAGHRVLAFSQFTSFLALVKKALDEEHITYKYLDGSTPEKERAKSISEFQGGEGEVFLLSLKAGGTGINLTAADYVIHLDPWWNPAVEDQASDRAHRLGQKRPVTIYRLVSEHTVEEKILSLHAEKRELAADFLDGTQKSVTHMTEDDLMELFNA